MSPVKFVHVLKRLEVLDRDIAELRKIEESLEKGRTYSIALNISIELQINHLLNEKVKLMELRIENPPEQLIPNKKEIDEPSRKLSENRGRFRLEDMEQEYLDDLMNKGRPSYEEDVLDADISYENKKTDIPAEILEQNDVDTIIAKYRTSKKPDEESERLPEKPARSALPVHAKKNLLSKEREEILKNLPAIDY
ncbi:MAG: hypothetical protein OEZ22_02015 [Spirochaetia bacterium]|nr:hypothetical protein [Spirochaetia bacterium]